VATFGEAGTGVNASTGIGDTKIAGKFSLSSGGNVTKLTAYVNAMFGGNAKGFIYSDISGEPNSLQGTTAEVAVNTSGSPAWVDFTFASSVGLSAGTYWLGLIFDNGGDINHYTDSSGGYRRVDADTYSDGPASSWGASDTSDDDLLSIYATYTPVTAKHNLMMMGAGTA